MPHFLPLRNPKLRRWGREDIHLAGNYNSVLAAVALGRGEPRVGVPTLWEVVARDGFQRR